MVKRRVVKQYRSIGTHLSAITGLLLFILVSMFAVFAIAAFKREREATDTLAVVQIERGILSAREDLRIEMWGLGNSLATRESTDPETVELILAGACQAGKCSCRRLPAACQVPGGGKWHRVDDGATAGAFDDCRGCARLQADPAEPALKRRQIHARP